MFEDTKLVMRTLKSKKDREHNGHNKKVEITNNDLHYTENTLKSGGEFKCSGRIVSSCSRCGDYDSIAIFHIKFQH